MDEGAARVRLERMVAASVDPALDDDAVGDLIEAAKRPDAYGLAPTDAAWTPTWDLNAAAAEGWRWKAAATSSEVDFSADGASVQAAALHAHCLEMAVHFDAVARSGRADAATGRTGAGVVGVSGRGSGYAPIIGNA